MLNSSLEFQLKSVTFVIKYAFFVVNRSKNAGNPEKKSQSNSDDNILSYLGGIFFTN